MSKDVTIARDIVAQLIANQSVNAFLRHPCRVVYSHQTHIDFEPFVETEIKCMPATIDHLKAGRTGLASWMDTAILRVSFAGKSVLCTDEETDDWLAFVDQIIDSLKVMKPGGKKAITIQCDQRLDRETLRTLKVFSTIYYVGYPLN